MPLDEDYDYILGSFDAIVTDLENKEFARHRGLLAEKRWIAIGFILSGDSDPERIAEGVETKDDRSAVLTMLLRFHQALLKGGFAHLGSILGGDRAPQPYYCSIDGLRCWLSRSNVLMKALVAIKFPALG